MEITIVGIAWFTRETYDAVRLICEDASDLPATFKDWLTKAERIRKLTEKRGTRVVRAYLDTEQFPAWCAAQGHKVDANGRMAYANWVARRSLDH